MNPMAIINPETDEEICKSLRRMGIEPIRIEHTDLVSLPLSGHPDLQVFPIENKIIHHPDISLSFLKKIDSSIEIIPGSTRLNPRYPSDIPYNVACTGKLAFHLSKCTDEVIKAILKSEDIPILNVKQGYSKCSTMVVSNDAIITSDTTIFNKAIEYSLNALLISPGFIELKGYDYGFIGGASGNINEYILLTGTFNHHPDHISICNFIEKRNKKVKYLSHRKAIDLGSLFIIGG